jgi:hypothetical protein
LIDETWRLNHMCSFDARLKESLHQAWNWQKNQRIDWLFFQFR